MTARVVKDAIRGVITEGMIDMAHGCDPQVEAGKVARESQTAQPAQGGEVSR